MATKSQETNDKTKDDIKKKEGDPNKKEEDLKKKEEDPNKKEEDLKKIIIKLCGDYVPPFSENDFLLLYDMFINEIFPKTDNLSGYVLYYVGIYYEYILKNIMLAKQYYTLAVKREYEAGIYKLGVLSLQEHDIQGAKNYFERASKSGDSNSIYMLGIILKDSEIENAIKYYKIAAEGGNIFALYELGNISLKKGNCEEAIEYYTKAAEKGCLFALNNKGVLLLKRGHIDEALECFKASAKGGNERAMRNLGKFMKRKGIIDMAKYYFIKIIKRMRSGRHNYYSVLNSKDMANDRKYAYKELIDIYKNEMLVVNDKDPDIDDDFLLFLSVKKYKNLLPRIFKILANIYCNGLEVIDLHVKYQPNGDGAKKAKEDFIKRMKDAMKSEKSVID